MSEAEESSQTNI